MWTCFLLVFCCFIFLGCFFFILFFFFLNPKTFKIFKNTKIFYFVSCFICFEDYMSYNISLSWFRTCLTLWRNLNSMCYISAKLFMILYKYVLVCTCTHGLIKKLIFLVCVTSIAFLQRNKIVCTLWGKKKKNYMIASLFSRRCESYMI